MAHVQPDSGAPRPKRRRERVELNLNACFLLAVFKRRRCLAHTGIQHGFIVFVMGGARPEADRVDKGAAHTILALGGKFRLFKIDPRSARRWFRAGNAVKAGVTAESHADKTARKEVRRTDALSLRLYKCVGLDAKRRAEIFGAARERIGMNGIGTGARVHLHRAFAALVGGRNATLDLPMKTLRRVHARNSIVAGAHHAANGLRPPTQSGRAANDLDPVRCQRVNRHAVILPNGGDIHHADAVLLQSHAGIIQPTDDRAACPGGVARSREAGKLRKPIPQSRAGSGGEFVLGDERHGRKHIGDDGAKAFRQVRGRAHRRADGRNQARNRDGDFRQLCTVLLREGRRGQ